MNPLNCSARFITLKKGGKTGLNSFFLKTYFFLQKLVFPISFWVLKKQSYTLHHNWQITLSGLETCYSMPALLKKTRINWPKSLFSTWRKLFLKNIVPTTSYVLKIDFILREERPKYLLELFIFVPWGLSCSILWRKSRPKLFFYWKVAFFVKFVFSTKS